MPRLSSMGFQEMERKFRFTSTRIKRFNVINEKNALHYLLKWSMKGQLHLVSFSFNQAYESYHKKEFVKNFFSNPELIQIVAKVLPEWAYESESVEDVELENVSCTVTSMSFFDRISDPKNNIVRKDGSLHHCVDDFIDDFVISDELRKMFLDENSDNYGLYNEMERKELIFRIFQHFMLGGRWCQFEDRLEPYLDMSKMLYKDLIEVQKIKNTNEIQIRSLCVKVTVLDKKGNPIFPQDANHKQNFAYLLIDPVLRHVTLFAHQFGGQF